MSLTLPAGTPPRVRHIGSRRIVSPLLGEGASFEARFDWLREEAADQAEHALRAAWPSPHDAPPLHLVCTTILSKMVSGWPVHAHTLCQTLQWRTGLRPAGIVAGYQCAGWGFALRFAAQYTAYRRLLFSIVDADLHDMMSRGYEDVIGGIGFGVTTVALELGELPELPKCDGPFINHGVTDLLHAVRAQHKRHGPLPTFMPFVPKDLARVTRHMVGESMAPNRHDHYGHTFGSDPWIGVAEWLESERPEHEHDVLLGAFAYDGYYTAGRVRVGPFTHTHLRPDFHPAQLTEAAAP